MATGDDSKIQKELNALLKEAAGHQQSISNILQSRIGTSKKLLAVQEAVADAIVDETNHAKSLEKLAKVRANLGSLLSGVSKKNASILDQQLKTVEAIVKRQKKGIETADALKDRAEGIQKAFDGVSGAIGSLPGGDFLVKAMGVDKLQTKMGAEFEKKSAKALYETGNIGQEEYQKIIEEQDALIDGANKISFAGAIASIGMLIGAIKGVVDMILSLDQHTIEFSRDMGIAAEEAQHLHHEYQQIARSSSDAMVSTENLMEAHKELAAATGMTAGFTEEMVKSQITLTKNLGLAGDEAAEFQKQAMLSDVSTEQLMKDTMGVVEQINKATGASLSHTKILQKASKVSASIKANYGGMTKELIKAVAQAEMMGMELEDMQGIADGLLDIESSLEAEMEARVMTGKNINMDLARSLALQGDIAGASAEVMKQVGGYQELLAMEPLQREAAAKAAGMSVDQLMQAAEQQEMLNKLGVDSLDNATDQQIMNSELSDEQKEQLLEQRKQASMQERMNEAMTELKELFVQIMEVFTPIIDGFVYVVESMSALIGLFTGGNDELTAMQTIVGGIGMAITGILATYTAINAVKRAGLVLDQIKQGFMIKEKVMMAATMAKQVGSAIMGIAQAGGRIIASMSAIPIVGPAIGIALAATVAALIMSQISKAKSAKERGGVVAGKDPYLVGEKGPEIFTPNVAGNIIPNHEMADKVAASVSDQAIESGGAAVQAQEIQSTAPAPVAATTGGDTAALGPKLDAINGQLASMAQALLQPTIIKLGNRTIEEIGSQISLKKNMTLGLDSGYGNNLD